MKYNDYINLNYPNILALIDKLKMRLKINGKENSKAD